MSRREQLIQVVERLPEENLDTAMRILSALDTNIVGDIQSRVIHIPGVTELVTTKERVAAYDAWSGHLDLPPLPDEALDRSTMYRDEY